MVCATPRTGSYLLCEGMRATGVAGFPTEYLLDGFQQYWAPRWRTPDFASYLSRARSEGTSANGVFGIKVHGRQLVRFLRLVAQRAHVPPSMQPLLVERWFPEVRYTWLRRRDTLRQAVSYARSLQTRIWWDADEPPAPYEAPRPQAQHFSFALLERCLDDLAEEDAVWERYFSAAGETPLVLEYEDVVADTGAAVRAVLAHTGIEAPDEFQLPPTRFSRLADEGTERWLEWFTVLRAAKHERTLAALYRAFPGTTAWVVSEADLHGHDPGDGITVAVHPGPGGGPPDYGLAVEHGDGDSDSGTGRSGSDVLFTTTRAQRRHPFVVRALLRPSPTIALAAETGNALPIPSGPCHPAWVGAVLGAWLGADRVVVRGWSAMRPSDVTEPVADDQRRRLAHQLGAVGVTCEFPDVTPGRARPYLTLVRTAG